MRRGCARSNVKNFQKNLLTIQIIAYILYIVTMSQWEHPSNEGGVSRRPLR